MPRFQQQQNGMGTDVTRTTRYQDAFHHFRLRVLAYRLRLVLPKQWLLDDRVAQPRSVAPGQQ